MIEQSATSAVAAAFAPLAAQESDLPRIWLILGLAGGGLLLTCIVAVVVAISRRRPRTEGEQE